MLACALSDVEGHDYLSEDFLAAYGWLAKTDLQRLAPGSYPIARGVTANVQEYVTEPACDRAFEAHDEFYDIQYVISGVEAFGVCPREGLVATEARPEDDITFYEEPERPSMLVLNPGELVVVPTEQAHKPRCCVEGPAAVRKVVIKVKA